MEQMGQTVQQYLHVLLTPLRAALETLGYEPSDMQVWALAVALFVLCLIVPVTYGDWMLSRRQLRAKGVVLDIDRSGEAPYSPLIGFRDAEGRKITFTSGLPLNGLTGQIGAEVEVFYDPRHPKRAREAGRPVARALIALAWYGMAALLLAYALARMPGG